MRAQSRLKQFNLVTGALDEPAHAPRYSLDAKLDELLPGDPHAWPRAELDLFTEKVVHLLVEDMLETFDSHHARDARGELAFADEDDRRDFTALLGWVCGYWRGAVPFEFAMKLFGFNPRAVREAVIEAYGEDLHLAREVLAARCGLH